MFNIKMSVEKSSIINQIKNIAVIIDYILFSKKPPNTEKNLRNINLNI